MKPHDHNDGIKHIFSSKKKGELWIEKWSQGPNNAKVMLLLDKSYESCREMGMPWLFTG